MPPEARVPGAVCFSPGRVELSQQGRRVHLVPARKHSPSTRRVQSHREKPMRWPCSLGFRVRDTSPRTLGVRISSGHLGPAPALGQLCQPRATGAGRHRGHL